MKLTKEKEDRIDMRLDDLYQELHLDGVTSKQYGSIVQRLHDAVKKAKEISKKNEN